MLGEKGLSVVGVWAEEGRLFAPRMTHIVLPKYFAKHSTCKLSPQHRPACKNVGEDEMRCELVCGW